MSVDELSAHRARKAGLSGATGPHDVLNLALAELETEQIESVLVIAIRPDGEQITYYGGPAVSTHRKAWGVLQTECLAVIDRMTQG